MKDTIQELSGETTTASSGISTIQGQQWLDTLMVAAKQKMFFQQFAKVVNVAKGNKDITVPIRYTNKTFTSFSTEATSRTMTEVDNEDGVVFTPVPAKLGAIIAKEVVQTSRVDIIEDVRDQLAYDAALKIDTSFSTAIAAASSPAATLYGGDATSTATLESGDVLTPALVNKAERYLGQNGWFPENDKPFVLFIPPTAKEALRNDSQFVNASEYGNDKVVKNGEIGEYLGIKVVVSNQCPSASTWGSGSLDGHTCFLVKAQVAYGIAYREQPTLDWEYEKDDAAYKLYLDMAYQCKTLQEGAIVLIKVSDE